MKNNQIGIIAVVLVLLVAIFTNPSQTEHKEKIKETFTNYYQKSLDENKIDSENNFAALGSLLGETLINQIIEKAVTRENYVIFSITKITFKGEKKSIGYGIFGNVFLSKKIEDTLNKNLNQ
ncbi:DUF4359 domain-containing protein [Flavobacterium ponti]|uniref:DUF4359 domain-containing protein n=1 Tax=Flavobacterium ponti TaxID=665133 RepID=A0ABV9P0A9_9FLAO